MSRNENSKVSIPLDSSNLAVPVLFNDLPIPQCIKLTILNGPLCYPFWFEVSSSDSAFNLITDCSHYRISFFSMPQPGRLSRIHKPMSKSCSRTPAFLIFSGGLLPSSRTAIALLEEPIQGRPSGVQSAFSKRLWDRSLSPQAIRKFRGASWRIDLYAELFGRKKLADG